MSRKIIKKGGKNKVKNNRKMGGKVSTLGGILGLDSGKKNEGGKSLRKPTRKTRTHADNKQNFWGNNEGKIVGNMNKTSQNVSNTNNGNLGFGSRRWEGAYLSKALLLMLIPILLLSFIFLVSALSDGDKATLQTELANLTSSLNDNGYSWLVDYNISYPSVEVYRQGDNSSIATFDRITGGNTFNKYQIFLTNLGDNESYQTFDLKSINGDINYDYVVDPRVYGIPKGMNLLNNTLGTFAGISATSAYSGQLVSLLTDNQLGANGWLSTSSTNQNITINFTKAYDFDTIEILPPRSDSVARSPNNTNVWISDDSVTWTNIASKSLFGAVPVIGQNDKINFTQQTKRYVRLEFKDNWGDASYIGANEIRVYKNSTNLANLSTTILTATQTRGGGYNINGTRDGSFISADANRWDSDAGVSGTFNVNITWNFGSAKNINSLELADGTLSTNYFPKNYSLLSSSDGTTWTEIKNGTFIGGGYGTLEGINFSDISTQYLKLWIKTGYDNTYITLTEIRIWEQNDSTAAGELCDAGSYSTTCNISTIHYMGDGDLVLANNINILNGGSLQNMTANCSGSSHGCGFSIVLTGNLTIFPGGNITAGNISITAANVNVQANATRTGMIITDGLGWMAGRGPCGSASYGVGACYGGLKNFYSPGGEQGNWSQVYGSAESPTDFGSGGETARGGGIIFINSSGSLNITGIITSNGNNGGSAQGPGTGGSVWIISTNLYGTGNLTAKGGGLNNYANPSGGRIRNTFTTSSFSGIISVAGWGTGIAKGFAGTYSQSDGNNLTVKADMALAGGTYSIPYLNITNDAILDVQPNTTFSGNGSGVVINCINVNIDSGAKVSGEGMGFDIRNTGPGAGDSATKGSSYGGFGQSDSNLSRIYGSETYPTSLGSTSTSVPAGGGGGAIFLNCTGNVTINGNISVIGASCGSCGGGSYTNGGTGGSILIVANGTISGSGILDASGGTTGQGYKAPGGGRIALHAGTIALPSLVQNKGGYVFSTMGSAGTIYINATTSITSAGNITATGYNGTTARINFTSNSLILTGIYNATATVTPNGTISITKPDAQYCSNNILTGTFAPAYTLMGSGCTSICNQGDETGTCNITTNHINISDGTVFNFNNLNILNGGSLGNATANCSGSSHGCGFSIVLTGNLTIYPGGNITAGNISITAANVDAQANATRTGKIISDNLGWRGIPNGNPSQAYGGFVHLYNTNNFRGYGNYTWPVDFGSGSSTAGYGSGGGIIFINASGDLNVTGVVSSSASGLEYIGSGGSVLIIASNLSGNGNISASSYLGWNTGSGGRIAIYRNTDSFSGFVFASASKSGLGTAADPGTYYWALINGTVPMINLTLKYDVALAPGAYTFDILNVTNRAQLFAQGINVSSTGGYGVNITANNVYVEANSLITADLQGFPTGTNSGPGSGSAGVSYGGLGSGVTNLSKTYGSENYPTSLGSSPNVDSGIGGGAIFINSLGNISITGNISSRGQVGAYRGGAGGSILLIANGTISGSGNIFASGGAASDYGAAGGGRIALHASTITLPNLIENKGGAAGAFFASAGTIYINATTSITSTGNITATGYNGTTARINFTAPLITLSGIYNASAINQSVAGVVNGTISITKTDNQYCSNLILTGSFIPSYTLMGSGCNICDQGDATSACNITSNHVNITDATYLSFNNLNILNGGSLANSTSNCSGTNHGCGFRLSLTGNLTIFPGGNITAGNISIIAANVDVQANATRTGRIITDGLGWIAGVGSGQYGSIAYYTSNWSAVTYGNASAPTDFGNGATHTAGGGIVFINSSNNLTVSGTVTSDGAYGSGPLFPGSGGSVWLISTVLTGGGNISASTSSGGRDASGGRVRNSYTTNNFNGFIKVSGAQQRFHGSYSFPDGNNANLTVKANMALAGGTYTINTLNITNNAILEVQPNSFAGNGSGVVINCVNAYINSGSKISGDGLGFIFQTGPGYNPSTFGASHGGLAGSETNLARIYGSETYPTELGSGGYSYTGGGAIYLNCTGNVTINGNISMLSYDVGANDYTGAGGSILVVANNLIANSSLNTRGANAGNRLGGGGGRIALHASTMSLLSQIINNGGTKTTGSEGSAGTIYINATTSITSAGNITATGYNGTTARVTFVTGLATLSGIYNSSSTVNPQGSNIVNYSDCASVLSGNFIPSATKNKIGASCSGSYTMNLTYPENNSYFNISQVSFNASTSLYSTCLLSLNGAGNTTMQGNSSYTGFNYTNSSIADSQYNTTLVCSDTLGDSVSSSIGFLVDTTYPLINFTSQTPANNAYQNINSLFVNVSVTDTNPSNITFYLYNNTNTLTLVNSTTFSMANQNSNTSINWTLSGDTIYYYNATITDKSGNKNNTETRTFTRDNTYPLIDYTTGTAVDYANLSQSNIFVNVSVTETNPANITFYLFNYSVSVNTTTYSMSSQTANNTINWTGLSDSANYTYNVTITDSAGNINTTATRHITLDTVSPSISVAYPTAMNYSVNVSALNYTRSDATAGLFGCWYSLNNGQTNSTIDATCGNYTGLTSNEGWNNWTVYVNDSSGNANSSMVTFFKDTINPLISYGAGTENSGTNFSRNWIFVNVSVTETNPVNVTYYLYNMTAMVNTTTLNMPSANINNTFNFTGLVDINYYSYNATICDVLGICNSTETRTQTLDDTPPVITILYPLNTTTHYVATLPINVTSIDNIMGTSSCWYNIDNGALNYSLSAFNTTFYNSTYTIAHGLHNLTAWCNDTLNNVNSASMTNFNVNLADLTVLNVSLSGITYSMNSTLVTINISNLGPPTVTNVNISCYADGVIKNSRVLATVAGLTSYITNCTVNFPSGNNQNLTVLVDPQNTIPESNEGNNNYMIYVNVTMIGNIAIVSPLEANTTDTINVNGNMIGNDGASLGNKLFTIKLNNVTVSSNYLNYTSFTLGAGENVNISSVVKLNLTSESVKSQYTDDFSTTKYTTEAYNYSNIGYYHSSESGYIFELNNMPLAIGNVTYKFTSVTNFFNASVRIQTQSNPSDPGGNTSLWWGTDGINWNILGSSTSGGANIIGYPNVKGTGQFYVMIKSDTHAVGGIPQNENPVTNIEVNYTNYDYSSAGTYNSSSINLANVTYTLLKWSQQLNGGEIKIQMRESDDASTWGEWGNNYTSNLDNDISAFTKQYVQLRAFLSTGNLSLTPSLQAVQIYYFNASTNSSGGYSYNITIPTNSLGVQPLQLSIIQNSGVQITGINQTNISVWARTSLPYYTVKNYSGESNYSVYVNFTRSDIGSNVNGEMNISISNSSYSLSKTCSGSMCLASWLTPSQLGYGNYTVNITGSNESAYYRNYSVSFADYLEEKNTTGNLEVLNKSISNYNPAVNYSFYWNALINNTGKASMNSPHVWAAAMHSAIQSVSEVTPCQRIYPGESCNAVVLITIKTNVNPSDAGYYITWRANWTDNDGSVTGGSDYIQYSDMKVLIIGNASLSLSNFSINRTVQHNSNTSFTFNVLSVGSNALSSINVSFLSQNITAGGTILQSWVSISPGWINSIAAGGSSAVSTLITVPAQTSPGNYSGIINASADAGGEKLLNVIVEVPLNTSWYYLPAANFTYNRSFSLNLDGEIGNITITNTGNVNMTMNLSYSPVAGTTDYTTLPGLFSVNKVIGGMTANPTSINITKGENSTITLVHNGWDEEKLDIGIKVKMYNESASPVTAYYQDAWEIKEQSPNITYVWFYLDGAEGGIAEQRKNVTIKFRGTDDVDLNLTGSTLNISWSGGQTQIAASDLSGVVGGTEYVTSGGKYTVMNYTGNFTPTTAEQYSVIANVRDISGKAVSSQAYTFTSYGTTTFILEQNISIVNISTIDLTHKSTFYVNYTINNTGLVKGYSLNLSFSGNSSIIAGEKILGDVSGGTNTSTVVQINVSELTPSGQYNLTATLKWTNPNLGMGTATKILVINVAQNKSMTNIPATPSLSVNSGGSNSTNLLINNTGNDNLNSISLSCYSGALCSSFTFSANESSFSIARNSSRNVNITLTAPNGLAAGSYSGFVNISEQSISKTFEIQASVPQTKTWTASSLSINMTRGASGAGKLADVTITNTGNVNMTFNLATTNSSLIEPNVSSMMVPSGTSAAFAINYTSPAEETSYFAIIKITNVDSGASPVELNVSVNLTVTALGIVVISPTSASPVDNLTAGQNIEIIANATYGGVSITANLTWNASIDSTACSETIYAYDSANDYWNLTCTLPSLTDGRYHNVTVIASHSVYGVLSQTESNVVYYRDITPPSFIITRNHINLNANINLQAVISDNVNISQVSAVLTYPNLTEINISLSLSGGYYINNSIALNLAGEYFVNYTANDTTGNINSTTDWFEVYDKYSWVPRLLDYANSAQAGINITLFRQNTTTVLMSNLTDSAGRAGFSVNRRNYDIKAVFSGDYILVKNVNFTNVSSSGITFNLYRVTSGDLAEAVTLHKTFQGFASNSTNLSGNEVQAVFNYTGLSYTSANKLEVVKCANWNFTSRACSGIWSSIVSSRDSDGKSVMGNSSGFSAYFLSENTCGDGACQSTYGETTGTCPADCKETSVTVSGGGGGGGGGSSGLSAKDLARIEEIVKSFLNIGGVKLETTSIYKELFAGDTATVRISLKNTLASPITISLSAIGDVKQFISFENSEITIEGSGARDVLIRIIAPKMIDAGNYEGDLVLKSGEEEGKIPVTIKILEPEGKLLDVKIQPLTPTVAPGGILRLQTDLLNLGKTKKVDVQFDLQLLDVNSGEIMARNEEAFAVETTISTVKNMTIPINIKTGKYMVKATATYSNIETTDMQASSIAYITVEYPFFSRKLFGLAYWIYALLVLLILAVIGAYFYFLWLNMNKRRFKVKVELNKLPQAGANSAFVGKIAETGIRAFTDLNKLQMHTLIAGATGSGKTVAAQDMVEAALLHNKSVIIFDPTAQWTGFLRKCEDKGMLKRYSFFDMNQKEARAFNGTVKTIHDPYELIDIKKYMNRPGEISIFNISHLTPKEIDIVVASTIEQIFASEPEESKELNNLIVYDEVHRLLPKFGGSGQGFIQLERGAREFRKWGIGLVLISQVLSDFVGEVKANIGTEVQMGTRYEGDLERVNMKYGEDVLKSVVKEPIGTGMVVNAEYNSGRPYFVSFRPMLHSTKRLSNEELVKYEKYFEEIEDIEYQLEKLKEFGIDVLDIELEIKLAKGKVKEGQFQMAEMYMEGLRPRVEDYWKKAKKSPVHLVKKKISKEEINAGIKKAKKEREKYIKKNPQQEAGVEQEVLNLKKEIEEKKKKGKKTSDIEMKFGDLDKRVKERIKAAKGKLSKEDSDGIKKEIEAIKLETQKL